MTWPTRAELAKGFLATPCFRCGAPPGIFCRTDPGGEPKCDPYTGKPAYHQRRMDKWWTDHQGMYRLPERQRFKPEGVLE